MTEKKRIISVIVSASLFVILLAAYLLVFLPMSRADSEETASAPPVLEEWEDLGIGNTILMAKRSERGNIASLEVENEHGNYTFVKTLTSSGEKFVLEGNEDIPYSDMAFSMLIVTTGIPTSSGRITTEATAEDIKLYGLDDPLASWKLTTEAGEVYEIAVGSKMLSGGGYYAMRKDHPTHVYVLSNAVEQSVLLPVESMLNPIVCAGINTNNYLTCDDFELTFDGKPVIRIRQREKEEFYNPDAQIETQITYPGSYKTDDNFLLVNISLLDKYSVESTEAPNTDGSEAVQAVYLGDDPEVLRKYGLGSYYYNLSFTIDAEIGSSVTYKYDIRISTLQDDGYYYVTSNYYNYKLVMKCPKDMFSWIELDSYENGEPKVDLIEWIDEDPIMLNISYVDSIMLDLDGSVINYTLKHGTNSDGNATLEVTADNGFRMTDSDIYIFRNYYKVMLGIKLMADSELTDEDVERLTSDESRHLATLRFNMKDGSVNEYKFYRDTTRRALMTSDGNAQFYVLADWLEKLISDTDRLMMGLEIDSSMKY
ncbi:MAG: DUF4340 domain-containing protein [Clostridia bacterium]|nr:DUF4340 domain-containing protein [Clostridia bacterium]